MLGKNKRTNNEQVFAKLGPSPAYQPPKPTNTPPQFPVPRLTGYEAK
jgi:hypothetical protein